MGWVLFFHITRKFCVPEHPNQHLNQCAALYLGRFIPVRRLWRKQHMGEQLGEQSFAFICGKLQKFML